MSREESAEKKQSESVWFARKNNLCIEPSPPCLSTVCRYHTTELHFTRNVFCFFYKLNVALSGQGLALLAPGPLQREVRRPLDSRCSHDRGLPYDLVRPLEQPLRNRQAQRLRGLEIDHQLELHWLLDGQVGGLGALQDLVDVRGGTSVEITEARPVRHETPGLHTLPDAVCCRQAAPGCEVCEPCSVGVEDRI